MQLSCSARTKRLQLNYSSKQPKWEAPKEANKRENQYKLDHTYLILHLLLLQLLHQPRNQPIDRNHQNHRSNTSQHAQSHQLIQAQHTKHNLIRGAPQLLPILRQILQSLRINRHIINNIARTLARSTFIRKLQTLSVDSGSQSRFDPHPCLEGALEILM